MVHGFAWVTVTIALAACVSSGSPAWAEAGKCISIENDLDRLACYDKEAGRTPRVVEGGIKNSWLIKQQTSQITDDTDVFLHTRSTAKVDCGWNRNDHIRLTLRCLENTTALIISTGCHMASGTYNDYGDVTYRLDEEKARKIGMHESTDNRALGLWRGNRSIPFIKRMLNKQRMIVRMTPYGQSPFTATFNIAGLEEAIEPLRKECGW